MTPMPITSWNDTVRLHLSDFGIRVYDAYLESLGLTSVSRLRADGTVDLALWEAAQIFGGALYNGCVMPFRDSSLRLREVQPELVRAVGEEVTPREK